MIHEYLRACFLIFMAEMGDKTQILAMAFATRFTVRQVLLGVGIGSLLNHGLAVALGSFLSTVIPLSLLRLIAALSFLGFGMWTLMTEEEDEDEGSVKGVNPVITVATAFFVGELGDKTQLAAITLSTGTAYPLIVLMGTVSGMILTSGVGIFVGTKLGDRIPELAVKLISSAIFTVFGLVALYDSVPPEYLSPLVVVAVLAVVLITNGLLVRRVLRRRALAEVTPLQQAAARLRAQAQRIRLAIADVCLGHGTCGNCDGRYCAVGYVKAAMNQVIEHNRLLVPDNWQLPVGVTKDFDSAKVANALVETVLGCLNCGQNHDPNCAMNRARQALELMCFGEVLPFRGDKQSYLTELQVRDAQLAATVEKELSA